MFVSIEFIMVIINGNIQGYDNRNKKVHNDTRKATAIQFIKTHFLCTI